MNLLIIIILYIIILFISIFYKSQLLAGYTVRLYFDIPRYRINFYSEGETFKEQT